MLPFFLPQKKGRFAPFHYIKTQIQAVPPVQAKFSGLELFYWATMASTSLTAVYLKSQNLDASQIGYLTAFFSFVGIFSPPFWGMMSDKLRSVKWVFVLCMVVSAIAWALSPTIFSKFSIGMVWVLFPIARFFFGPTNALMDSWLVRTVSTDKRLSYGSIRMFGSIGFAAMSIAYTYLIRATSINIMFYGYALLMIPTVIIALRMKDDRQSKRAIPFKEMQIGRLLKNSRFICFLIFNVALYMPVNASITYLPYLIESVGQDPAVLGTIIGFKALLEIPLFLFSGRLLKKFKPTTLLIVAACVYILEMFLYAGCSNIWQILAVQCMHGAMFSLYLSCQIQYVYRLAPKDLSATAQTMAGAATALAGIFGGLMGGAIVSTMGIRPFYMISGALLAVAAVFFFLSVRLAKPQEPEMPAIS